VPDASPRDRVRPTFSDHIGYLVERPSNDLVLLDLCYGRNETKMTYDNILSTLPSSLVGESIQTLTPTFFVTGNDNENGIVLRCSYGHIPGLELDFPALRIGEQ
jgi:hypothetical protein